MSFICFDIDLIIFRRRTVYIPGKTRIAS